MRYSISKKNREISASNFTVLFLLRADNSSKLRETKMELGQIKSYDHYYIYIIFDNNDGSSYVGKHFYHKFKKDFYKRISEKLFKIRSKNTDMKILINLF